VPKTRSIIRRSTLTLNFANQDKADTLASILTESKRVVNVFINRIWAEEKFTGKFFNLKTSTWLSARMQQACSKQAFEIVKSQRRRKAKIKPELKKETVNLDSRFVEIQPGSNSFDLWVKFGSMAEGIKFQVPVKKHRQFNKFAENGWKLKGSTRLARRGDQLILDVYFTKDLPAIKSQGKIIGIDVGYKHTIVTSDKEFIGKEFPEITAKIQRKRQGSKAFKKALIERDQFIDRCVKEIPFNDLKVIGMEDLKCLKNGRRFRKKFQAKFQRWTYPKLLNRIELTAQISGVHVEKVNPSYTSQTCCRCGHRDKNNRKGEAFICAACDWSEHSDVVGSLNVLLRLRLPEHMDPVQKVSPG
jgi:putative transposase